MSDYVSRWDGDVTPSLPLLRDLDREGIPDHLVELWYIWQIPVECGFCHRHYSAKDAIIIGKTCDGRFHRPKTLYIQDGYAVAPCVFLRKIQVTDETEKNLITIDTFEEANSPLLLRGPVVNRVVYPVNLADQFKIPQPTVESNARVFVANMLDYIAESDRREALEESLDPWEPLVFIKLF